LLPIPGNPTLPMVVLVRPGERLVGRTATKGRRQQDGRRGAASVSRRCSPVPEPAQQNEAPGRFRQLHVADGFRLRTWRALQYPVMLVSGVAG
jgi:hypothetical protein